MDVTEPPKNRIARILDRGMDRLDRYLTRLLERRAEKQAKRGEQQYGFTITFIDDNSVHVRDATGYENAFAFPMENTSMEKYEKFIEQMSDRNGPLPSIENMVCAIGKTLAVSSDHPHSSSGINDTVGQGVDFEVHARKHGLSAEEMEAMYYFARRQLYDRFRARLRGQEGTTSSRTV